MDLGPFYQNYFTSTLLSKYLKPRQNLNLNETEYFLIVGFQEQKGLKQLFHGIIQRLRTYLIKGKS